tara:strand:- start:4950 stop:5633 length:684 start_codon:yes stop_codon:yes gene_type:complete
MSNHHIKRIHSFQIPEEERMGMLLDKCEAMSVLCQKATQHWSLIKFAFQIPLILTSSVMCIMNSFDDDRGNMKIPNVVVNGASVLILALQNNLKVPEKVELFKSLSNNFLQLAHQLEGIDEEDISKNNINTFIEKYDSYVILCQFEDVPKKIKLEVIELWEGRSIPLQLNGASGLKKKIHLIVQLLLQRVSYYGKIIIRKMMILTHQLIKTQVIYLNYQSFHLMSKN